MPKYQLHSLASADVLAGAVADRWMQELAQTRDVPVFYCAALAGGRTAGSFFRAVAERARARVVSLMDLHFFWGDERCVPPTDADSNFALARRHLLDPLEIQPEKSHRVRGEIAPEWAAQEAQAEICRIAPMNGAGQPVVDLIFL